MAEQVFDRRRCFFEVGLCELDTMHAECEHQKAVVVPPLSAGPGMIVGKVKPIRFCTASPDGACSYRSVGTLNVIIRQAAKAGIAATGTLYEPPEKRAVDLDEEEEEEEEEEDD